MSTITTTIQKSLKEFTHIVASQVLKNYESEVVSELWFNELGRLRVWAANLGAHQTGQSSLDFRLREASHLKDQILRVLGRLQRTIQDLEDLLHGTVFDEEYSSDSDDTEEESQTEIQKVYHALHDTIDVLFENAVAIRRPAHHDRLLGMKRSDTAEFEIRDRRHVAAKFPFLSSEICNRLGLAITQRRAILKYREQHHLKIAREMSETVLIELEVKPIEDYAELQSRTSQTSYAESITNQQNQMGIPPPPNGSLSGDPFECPCCFLWIRISNNESWTQHLFRDLMPYVCVFTNCRIPNQLYESRHEWYAHLQNEHSVPDKEGYPLSCPLCDDVVDLPTTFQTHLERHLQELALIALPQPEADKDHSTFKCEWRGCINGDVFPDRSSLWDHVKNLHVELQPFKCPLCDFVTDWRRLRAHRLEVHKDECEQQSMSNSDRHGRWKCEWGGCEKGPYIGKGDLARHIRGSHSWEKFFTPGDSNQPMHKRTNERGGMRWQSDGSGHPWALPRRVFDPNYQEDTSHYDVQSWKKL